MKFHFSKMHGLGNDYVYVNCLEQPLCHPEEVAKRISDRHFGIGSDGLILICPSDRADFKMCMYNADGSEGNMCGNGIRCLGKFVYDHHLTHKTTLKVDTKSGVKQLFLAIEKEKVSAVTVHMGTACTDATSIPIKTSLKEWIDQPICIQGTQFLVTCVSMGNPHAVVFCDDVDHIDLATIGPAFTQHPLFPEGVNLELIQLLDQRTLKMRVWERGSGETFACGTGACAAVYAAILHQYCPFNQPIDVQLRGGSLEIVCDKEDRSILMKGPATSVFEGEILLEDL